MTWEIVVNTIRDTLGEGATHELPSASRVKVYFKWDVNFFTSMAGMVSASCAVIPRLTAAECVVSEPLIENQPDVNSLENN